MIENLIETNKVVAEWIRQTLNSCQRYLAFEAFVQSYNFNHIADLSARSLTFFIRSSHRVCPYEDGSCRLKDTCPLLFENKL